LPEYRGVETEELGLGGLTWFVFVLQQNSFTVAKGLPFAAERTTEFSLLKASSALVLDVQYFNSLAGSPVNQYVILFTRPPS